jgi:prepilin-type processing-associated H-X9-DG protein
MRTDRSTPRRTSRPRQTREPAFSRADLLAIVAVLAMVGVLQLPALGDGRGRTKAAICLDNLRQLTRGWLLFAAENDGRLMGNLDGGDAMSGLAAASRGWCVGWLDFSRNLANTNRLFLTEAQLGPYVHKVTSIYRCPEDTSVSLHGGVPYPRVRSVSMNSYVGERAAPYTTGFRQFRKLEEITKPSPAGTFVFIDEREDSINDPSLMIDMNGSAPRAPAAYVMVDFPADWHNRGANLSFADGHVEPWHWRDPCTMPRHRPGTLLGLAVPSPNNPDVARIQAAASSKLRP